MKQILISFFFASIAANAAHAQIQESNLKTANLERFQLQPGTDLAQRNITSGTISVDLGNQDLNLTLFPRSNCPPEMACAAVMPAPVVFDVALTSVSKGDCQQTIYKGIKDLTPVDGARTEITVIDNSTNTCMYLVAIPATEVQLVIEGDFRTGAHKETHVMTAGPLQ
jgi:hypothetical protein